MNLRATESRFGLPGWVVASALALWVSSVPSAQEELKPLKEFLRPGHAFPAASYGNLNPSDRFPATIDLADYIGKKPFLLHYWIPTNTRSEEMLQELDRLSAELGDGLPIFGVAVPREQLPEASIRKRIEDLQIKLPVLRDDGFDIGQRLRVTSVPNLTLVDAGGKMQMSNAASLAQVVGYNVTVESSVRRLAEGGSLMTYGYLDRYYPVTELEGSTSPDFRAPLLSNSVEQRWHSMIDDSKINVLIFWSVDCPHCRKSLPEIDAWVKANPQGVNVVTCANVVDEASKSKTAEFCKLNNFSLPTLVDDRARIGNLYKVTSTPTIVIVGPDGIVDSTIVSGHKDFGATMEEKKRALLKGNSNS